MKNTRNNPLKGLPVRIGIKTTRLPQGSVVPLNPLRGCSGSWSGIPLPLIIDQITGKPAIYGHPATNYTEPYLHRRAQTDDL